MRQLFRILSRSAGIAAATAALLLGTSALWAQGTNATLNGRVIDQNGAGLPGVSVTVSSSTTGFSRSVTT